jgi:hypothetical protein
MRTMGWRSPLVVSLCLCLAGLVFGASATAKSYPEHWFRTPDGVGLTFCEWHYYTGKSGNQQTEISCYHENNKQGAFVDSRADGFKTNAMSLPYPNTIKQGRFTLTHGIHVHIYKVGAKWRVAAWDSRPAGSGRTAYAYFIVGPGVLSQQALFCLRGPYPCSAGAPH